MLFRCGEVCHSHAYTPFHLHLSLSDVGRMFQARQPSLLHAYINLSLFLHRLFSSFSSLRQYLRAAIVTIVYPKLIQLRQSASQSSLSTVPSQSRSLLTTSTIPSYYSFRAPLSSTKAFLCGQAQQLRIPFVYQTTKTIYHHVSTHSQPRRKEEIRPRYARRARSVTNPYYTASEWPQNQGVPLGDDRRAEEPTCHQRHVGIVSQRAPGREATAQRSLQRTHQRVEEEGERAAAAATATSTAAGGRRANVRRAASSRRQSRAADDIRLLQVRPRRQERVGAAALRQLPGANLRELPRLLRSGISYWHEYRVAMGLPSFIFMY